MELAYFSSWLARFAFPPGAIQDKTMVWQKSQGYQETVSHAHQMDDNLSNIYQGDSDWPSVDWSLDNLCHQYPYPGSHLFRDTHNATYDEKATIVPNIDSTSYSKSFVPLGKTQVSKQSSIVLRTINRRPDTHTRSARFY